jgi:hypothetical protein
MGAPLTRQRLRPGRACERTRGVVRVASALARIGFLQRRKESRSISTTLLSAICDEHDRHCVCHLQQGPCRRAATCKDHIRRKRDHFRRVLA